MIILLACTDKKENLIFLIYIRKFRRDRPPYIWFNICTFPNILGSSPSYMNLQPIPYKFPYDGFESRHPSKIINGQHKRRSGRHTLACQKIYKKNNSLHYTWGKFCFLFYQCMGFQLLKKHSNFWNIWLCGVKGF